MTEQQQLEAIRHLWAQVSRTNGFYQRKIGERAIPELKAFQDFSLTTKQELADDQQANPPFGTNLTFPLAQYTRYHQTSGTTSAPIRWLDTPENWDAMVGCWRQILEESGVTSADRIFFAFSFGPFIGFWLAFEAGVRMGALCIPGGGMSSDTRVRCMAESKATVVCCTPTYALRLAETAGAAMESLSVRRVLVAGEPGGSVAATRDRISTAWRGAKVFDHHGMTEVGPVTYQCPETPGVLHVMEHAYLPEVINAREDGTGELVLTTLLRIGSPLIRYRTGDLVKPVKCRCGRPEMALEGGILGRVDDMVIIRGVNVYPSAVERIVFETLGAVEYQVRTFTADALPQIEITVEAAGDELQKLAAGLQATLGLRIPVRAAAKGALPRSDMKTKRWIKGSRASDSR